MTSNGHDRPGHNCSRCQHFPTFFRHHQETMLCVECSLKVISICVTHNCSDNQQNGLTSFSRTVGEFNSDSMLFFCPLLLDNKQCSDMQASLDENVIPGTSFQRNSVYIFGWSKIFHYLNLLYKPSCRNETAQNNIDKSPIFSSHLIFCRSIHPVMSIIYKASRRKCVKVVVSFIYARAKNHILFLIS